MHILDNIKNKQMIILFFSLLIQLMLGGIYAWSTFVPYLMRDYGLSKLESGLVFGFKIAFFTIAMVIAGSSLKKKGPVKTALTGSILFILGHLLASFSTGNFFVLMAGIGLFTGAGIGFAYVCPIYVSMEWFPKHRGLVTGISVAGFGAGAILLSSVSSPLLQNSMDVLYLFRLIGLVAGGLVFLSSFFMIEPKSFKEKTPFSEAKAYSYIFNTNFVLLFIGMFAGTFSGLLIISHLSPIGMHMGFSEDQSVFAISIFALGNVVGRILWGEIYDLIGSKTIRFSLLISALAIVSFVFILPFYLFILNTFVIGFAFGACFVIYATSIVNHYGVSLFPKLYPICFLAYGLSGLLAPSIGGIIDDKAGSYDLAIILSFVLSLSAVFLISYKSKNKAS
jgi:MFS transporter, OFA family, oxalate/formate antiporter